MGAASCSLCHDKNEPAHFRISLASLREFAIWNKYDRHRIAFEALRDPRALQMERLLHIKASEDRRCLACHSIEITAQSADSAPLNDGNLRHEALAQGVSCEVCHGRASLWLDRHWKKDEWADLKPAQADQKYGQFGMTNLHEPAKRIELCVSCHVGDVACGKFVTHDMFAAGHPPLPAFEIETFMDQMPPHWRPLLRNREPVGRAGRISDAAGVDPVTRRRDTARGT